MITPNGQYDKPVNRRNSTKLTQRAEQRSAEIARAIPCREIRRKAAPGIGRALAGDRRMGRPPRQEQALRLTLGRKLETLDFAAQVRCGGARHLLQRPAHRAQSFDDRGAPRRDARLHRVEICAIDPLLPAPSEPAAEQQDVDVETMAIL
jgi:hypothetical protein